MTRSWQTRLRNFLEILSSGGGSMLIRKDPQSRVLWNAGRETVDEIVVRDCMVHLEQLDDNSYYVAIYPNGSDDRVMINISAKKLHLDVNEEIQWDTDEEHEMMSRS
jgi:hypothetical protein